MRSSAEFARAFKGTRAGSARVLVAIGCDVAEKADLHPKVGFVVPKSVGNSVVRHRMYRQLRHIMRDRIALLAPGELVAVRVFPPAAGAASFDLARDIDRCIERIRRKEP